MDLKSKNILETGMQYTLRCQNKITFRIHCNKVFHFNIKKEEFVS